MPNVENIGSEENKRNDEIKNVKVRGQRGNHFSECFFSNSPDIFDLASHSILTLNLN